MGELINGRTPEEILTGLKCEVPCHKCAYKDHNFMKDDSCSYYVEQDIIALIQRLESERDAMLADMKGSRICALCAHWEAGINEPCMHCTFENNCFEWQGIKPKEDANGHQTD